VIVGTRDLLGRGEYRSAVLAAFRSAFRDTVRAYSLTVPASCTNRRFLEEFLRSDMGKLSVLLPELHGWYEPVRYGRVSTGDADAFLALVVRVYTETSLATIYYPGYQPASPTSESVFPPVRPRPVPGGEGP
jgi:hypothetical protein